MSAKKREMIPSCKLQALPPLIEPEKLMGASAARALLATQQGPGAFPQSCSPDRLAPASVLAGLFLPRAGVSVKGLFTSVTPAEFHGVPVGLFLQPV